MNVCIPTTAADLLDALPDYERAFESDSEVGHSIYYRCSSTHQLDETFGDMLYQIQDLEVKLELYSLYEKMVQCLLALPHRSSPHLLQFALCPSKDVLRST